MTKTGEVRVTNMQGIGFFGALALIFIVLKLTHVIAWSWWLVLAPLWAPTVVIILVGLAVLLTAALAGTIAAAVRGLRRRRRPRGRSRR